MLKETAEKSDYIHGPRRCFSGGAGLLSTAADYGRFLQMLLNGGELGSEGAYGWCSACYPQYIVEPKERLVAFFMTRLMPADAVDLNQKFKVLTYQAIVR